MGTGEAVPSEGAHPLADDGRPAEPNSLAFNHVDHTGNWLQALAHSSLVRMNHPMDVIFVSGRTFGC